MGNSRLQTKEYETSSGTSSRSTTANLDDGGAIICHSKQREYKLFLVPNINSTQSSPCMKSQSFSGKTRVVP